MSELMDAITTYLETTKEGYNWHAHWEADKETPDNLFRACINAAQIPEDEDKNFYACGSAAISDGKAYKLDRGGIDTSTPIALYRLLFLVNPETVDFSDMYKQHLFEFRSCDNRFLVSVELFKYELGLYFYCPKEALSRHTSGVIAGAPGANNGTSCADPEGQSFFAMVKTAVAQEWLVYSGNDFTV